MAWDGTRSDDARLWWIRGLPRICKSPSLWRRAVAFICDRPARRRPRLLAQFLLSMAIMAMIILAVSVWAVRRVPHPLALWQRRRTARARRECAAAARDRHHRDPAGGPRFQRHANALARSHREPHAPAGRHLARSAHPADTAAVCAPKPSRMCRSGTRCCPLSPRWMP